MSNRMKLAYIKALEKKLAEAEKRSDSWERWARCLKAINSGKSYTMQGDLDGPVTVTTGGSTYEYPGEGTA